MNRIERISILNHVIGPVMRGPSSSHTAAAWRIGRLAADLLGSEPCRARFTFDEDGSYACTCRTQGADLAFICGLLGIPLTDERYFAAAELAADAGCDIGFETGHLERADHPNSLLLELDARDGDTLTLEARSTGGGAILLTRIDDRPIAIDGSVRVSLETPSGRLRTTEPVLLSPAGEPLFATAAGMTALAADEGLSLGRLALRYEAELLDLSEGDVLEEIATRLAVMQEAIGRGLAGTDLDLQLLEPAAARISAAENSGSLPGGGLNTRAAIRALAVMHVAASRGVICAAPTGGSAGVIPGVLETLRSERDISPERLGLALLAAGAIGLIVARVTTFAAEVAGCQVEIGAAGAMAAAAVVETAGGSAAAAADAAAIALQNSMGSVCDLVQGIVEIPCHTRNAAAASDAFICADLILGGYRNPIPLDDTLEAVRQTGAAMPAELRCTARGGLAATRAARDLENRRTR